MNEWLLENLSVGSTLFALAVRQGMMTSSAYLAERLLLPREPSFVFPTLAEIDWVRRLAYPATRHLTGPQNSRVARAPRGATVVSCRQSKSAIQDDEPPNRGARSPSSQAVVQPHLAMKNSCSGIWFG